MRTGLDTGIQNKADSVIEELQECFEAEEPMLVEDRILPGDEVTVGDGAFSRPLEAASRPVR